MLAIAASDTFSGLWFGIASSLFLTVTLSSSESAAIFSSDRFLAGSPYLLLSIPYRTLGGLVDFEQA